jgi:hypothetical protein
MPYHGSKRGKRKGEDEMGKKNEKRYSFFLFCLSQKSFGGLPEPKDSGKLSQNHFQKAMPPVGLDHLRNKQIPSLKCKLIKNKLNAKIALFSLWTHSFRT